MSIGKLDQKILENYLRRISSLDEVTIKTIDNFKTILDSEKSINAKQIMKIFEDNFDGSQNED